MGAWESTRIHEHPVCCTGRNHSWVHGRSRASTSIHEHPVLRCTGRNRSGAYGRARASTSIHEHPVRCTCRNRSWVHGRQRAPTSIRDHTVRCFLRNRSGAHGTAQASTSIHNHHVRCTCRKCSWAHGRARSSTSILCAAQAGIAHGPQESTSIHEHPRKPCALHMQESPIGQWESTSIHEHPVRCTGRNRSCVHGRARSSTSTVCAAQVGIVHVPTGEHEHPWVTSAPYLPQSSDLSSTPRGGAHGGAEGGILIFP